MRIGYTSGVFDLFHVGYLNLLRRAKLDCDFLYVAVTSDEVTLELTGRLPAIPYVERFEILRAQRVVDAVVGKLTSDSRQMWEQLRFDVMYKGGDWADDARGAALEKEFLDLPVEVVYFPYTRSTSSVRLRSVLDVPGQVDGRWGNERVGTE
jgi:glycerol-3-phosphate cytidylyltransferase